MPRGRQITANRYLARETRKREDDLLTSEFSDRRDYSFRRIIGDQSIEAGP